MRGVRDALLVGSVAVVTLTLGVLGMGTSRPATERRAADAVPSDMPPSRIGRGVIAPETPAGVPTFAPATAGELRAVALSSGMPAERRRERRLTTTASPGANDLRSFLTNMARATHDGNAIGIMGEDADQAWTDDEAKRDR